MFTARAVGFLLIAVFLFFLADATNVGWVRIVDSVLWGMLGLSLVLQWLFTTAVETRLRLVKIERANGPTAPMEDDAVVVELELENRRFWRRYFVSATYDAPMERPDFQSQRLFAANLNGHSTLRLASRVTCYRRGLHHFGPVTIESQAPFGLFRRRRRKRASLSLLVYPRTYPMRRLALAEGAYGPVDHPQRARLGLEVIGSRYYYPGDPLKHIHWRNTARLRKLAVKEMQDTTERTLAVVFDVRQDIGHGRETTLEYSIKLAASIGLHAFRSGESIHLAAGRLVGQWVEAEPFLRELALLEPSDSPSLASLIGTVPGNSPAIAIVSATDGEGIRALRYSHHRPYSLAAVVLEGFGDVDQPIGAVDLLREAGVPTVVCRRGNLSEAIGALEDLGLTHDANMLIE